MTGSTRPLRVLALAPYPHAAPSTRVRVVQFQEGLARHGTQLTLHPFLDAQAYRAVRSGQGWPLGQGARAALRLGRVLSGAGGYDVVWIQRGVAPLMDIPVARAVAGMGVPVVYDFDDAVFLAQEGGRRWVEGARRPLAATRTFCQTATAVLAGNEYLADFARGVLGAGDRSKVQVLPSVVDTQRLVPAAPGPAARTPTLGWVGTDSTVPYLESLAPALESLGRRTSFRLLVIAGQRRPAIPGVDMEVRAWSLEDEPALLSALDVGLYPLDDTPWSRGKCGFKAIQYLSCGVPCVASPVGVLPRIVIPEETGLLADTDQAWVEACARLLAEAGTRARMGGAGRTLVMERYSVEAALPTLVRTFQEAAKAHHG